MVNTTATGTTVTVSAEELKIKAPSTVSIIGASGYVIHVCCRCCVNHFLSTGKTSLFFDMCLNESSAFSSVPENYIIIYEVYLFFFLLYRICLGTFKIQIWHAIYDKISKHLGDRVSFVKSLSKDLLKELLQSERNESSPLLCVCVDDQSPRLGACLLSCLLEIPTKTVISIVQATMWKSCSRLL